MEAQKASELMQRRGTSRCLSPVTWPDSRCRSIRASRCQGDIYRTSQDACRTCHCFRETWFVTTFLKQLQYYEFPSNTCRCTSRLAQCRGLYLRIWDFSQPWTIILPVVLYGCETWWLTLKEECRLRVFENRVLRRVFGPKRDEVTGEWRKLHN